MYRSNLVWSLPAKDTNGENSLLTYEEAKNYCHNIHARLPYPKNFVGRFYINEDGAYTELGIQERILTLYDFDPNGLELNTPLDIFVTLILFNTDTFPEQSNDQVYWLGKNPDRLRRDAQRAGLTPEERDAAEIFARQSAIERSDYCAPSLNLVWRSNPNTNCELTGTRARRYAVRCVREIAPQEMERLILDLKREF